jgi:GTPase SAR1 family protein
MIWGAVLECIARALRMLGFTRKPVKVLFLGLENAGKTTLMFAMKHGPRASYDIAHDPTFGLSMLPQPLFFFFFFFCGAFCAFFLFSFALFALRAPQYKKTKKTKKEKQKTKKKKKERKEKKRKKTDIEEMDVEGHKVRAYDLGGKQRDIWSDYLVSSGCVVFVVDASEPDRFPESKAELDVRLRLLFLFFFFSFFFFSFFLFFLISFLGTLGPWDLWTLGPGDLGTLEPWDPGVHRDPGNPSFTFFTFFYFFLLCAHLPGPTF